MLTHEEGYLFIQDPQHGIGYSEDEAMYLRELMQQQGLIKNSDGPGKNGISKLLAKGRKIASAPGGYKALRQAEQRQQELKERRVIWQDTMQQEQHQLLRKQHEQQVEQLRLSQLSTDAAVDSAASSKTSTRWAIISSIAAAIGTIVAAVATLIAYQANQANDASVERLQALEVQVKQLRQAATTSPMNPPQLPAQPPKAASSPTRRQ